MGTNILQIHENFLNALVAYQPTYSYRQIDTINSEKFSAKQLPQRVRVRSIAVLIPANF